MSTAMSPEAQAEQYYKANIGFGLGSPFMAVTFDALLCGVLICQLTHWLRQWKSDQPHTRVIVLFGVVAAFVTTIFTWVDYMNAFVYNFGKFSQFASFAYLGWYAFLDILTVVPVQLVFAERSYKINQRNPWVLGVDLLLILATFSSAITVTITTRGHDIFSIDHPIRAMLLVWPAICTTTHFVLTSTIIIGLLRSRQALRHTNKMIDRIIYTSLESQLPATSFALTAMTVLAIDPKSPIVPWIVIIHPKVFMVGCLAMINTRHTWQREGKIPSAITSADSRMQSHPSSSTSSDPSDEGPGTPRKHQLFRRASGPITSHPDLEMNEKSTSADEKSAAGQDGTTFVISTRSKRHHKNGSRLVKAMEIQVDSETVVVEELELRGYIVGAVSDLEAAKSPGHNGEPAKVVSAA